MFRSLIVLTLLGCNEYYGLDKTRLLSDEVDGCPEIGTTVPEYSPLLRAIIPRPCFNFTLDEEGRSAAVCNVEDVLTIETGDANELSPAQIAHTVGREFEDPALTPEGDHLIVRQYGPTLDTNVWSMYRRTGGGWTFERDIYNSPNEFVTVGVPSSGPDYHAMVSTNTDFRELSAAMDWTVIRTQPWADLGVSAGSQLNLSPDGLRLTFLANTRDMMYAERRSIGETFGLARPILTVPEDISSTVFMTRGCSRIYFSALGNVFYQSQQ